MAAPGLQQVSLDKVYPPKISSQEWRVLLACARPQSDQRRLNDLLLRPVDWSGLYTLAEEHGLMPLLSMRLVDLGRNIVSLETQQKLREVHRTYLIFTLRLLAELYRLLDRLSAENIDSVVIKGPVLSLRCYGDASARQYSDLDLIVRARDIQRSTEIMIELGCQPRVPLEAIAAGKTPGEYVFTRSDSDLVVEFHTERTFRYHPRQIQLEACLERKTFVAIDQRLVPALSAEDELVLICIHSAKHFWERLGWVADVAALSGSPDLDWARTMSAANEAGAERMLRIGLHLAVNMVALSLPSEMTSYVNSDPTAKSVAEQIAKRLPTSDSPGMGILSRAIFRMKMCEGFLPALSYLLRLSLSPTEDDWSAESRSDSTRFSDAIRRTIRLWKKYR
jgi:hypothetical protein